MNKSLLVAESAVKNLNKASDKVFIGNPGQLVNRMVYNLDVVEGHAIAVGIYKDDDITIAETYAANKTVLAPHVHEGKREVIQVTDGCVKAWLNKPGEEGVPDRDPDFVACKYGVIVFDPDVTHTVLIVGNSRLIVSTMPAEPYFPDGR